MMESGRDDSSGPSAMSPRPLHPRWSALALALLVSACRGRTPPAPTVDWKPRPGARAEAAALLLLDQDGMAKLACLPGHAPARPLFPGVALRGILDARWQAGPTIAGLGAASGDADPSSAGELVLLVPHHAPRRLAKGVRTARFSPDGAALAYEVAQARGGGAGPAPATSYVLELATNDVTKLEGLADPLWEADGHHLRATLLRADSEKGRTPAGHGTSLRVRWDRETGATTIDGPGSAQIPAPIGAAVAWAEAQRSTVAPAHCTVLLNPRGGVMHTTVGRFCMGIADDRSVRWSPDGRWLAFPHPGRVPGQGRPGFFVDVVSVAGGRYPALSALYARARAGQQLAIDTHSGAVWFDWSPSGRFLALQDGASDLCVYDFEAAGTAFLGKGQRPMWSPGGAYLLILAAGRGATTSELAPRRNGKDFTPQAFVLESVAPTASIDLGQVRDARWLPAEACEK